MQIAVLAVIYTLMRHTKLAISKQTTIAGIFAVLFAGTFAIWTSDIGLSLSAVGLLASNGFLVLFTWGHHGIFHHPFFIIIDSVKYGIETLLTRLWIFGDISFPKTNEKGSAIVRGAVVAIPILIIFFLLFLSSDIMLQEKTSGLQTWFSNTFGEYNLIIHALIIGLFTFIFLLIFASMFWKRLEIALPKIANAHSKIESMVILLSSNALFLFFLIFQGFYLFGGQKAFEKLDITYSEYAVAGFNQLAVVSVLVLLLILTLRHFHGARTESKIIKFSELGLLAQTIALLISAWARLTMYVEQYGYTPSRLFGFWFFALSTILIMMLAAHIIKSTAQNKYISEALIIVGCAMLLFTALSPDALTVRLNMTRALETQNKEIDPFPLFHQLSADAYGLMDHVLTSNQYEIGLIQNASITDYCGSVRAHYDEDNKIYNFTIIPENNEFGDDIIIRQEIARFQNRWLAIPNENDVYSARNFRNADWRSWNFARTLLPDGTIDEIDENGIPYPANTIAHACGMNEGDSRY
jgi:hypothetical protein